MERFKSSCGTRHVSIMDTTLSEYSAPSAVDSTPQTPSVYDEGGECSSYLRPTRRRFPLRGVAFLLFGTFVLVAVAVGVSKIRAKPTLHVVFPASNVARKVRMFSDFPDLTELSKNHSSLSLVSRLQLLDTSRCRDQLQTCKMSIVCDPTTDQVVNCRCRHGYYFHDWKCHVLETICVQSGERNGASLPRKHSCKNSCPAGHYLVSACSIHSDAICKPCTTCGKTQYQAAPCNTHKDTICIDVSFPVGILPLNRSHLPDDRLRISVTHSPNVFLERLADMASLENTWPFTNNQQGVNFKWERPSGLKVAVNVTDMFLVPDYRDVSLDRDERALFFRLLDSTQRAKDYYDYVQYNYCRHPVPDYYSLQLLKEQRLASAEVVNCDSTDPDVPTCPAHYKDGDRYLKWDINKPCKYQPVKDRPPALQSRLNSAVCTEETPLLRQVFNAQRPTTVEFTPNDEECKEQEKACLHCLENAQCLEGVQVRNHSEFTLNDYTCCGIPCYNKPHCQKYYSPSCPQLHVECGEGEVHIFSLYPQYTTMERQFACHLRYHPPPQLYRLLYTISVESIGLELTPKLFTVAATSRGNHQRRISRFDFLQALHDVRMPVEDDLILVGDHLELSVQDSIMRPYIVRKLKTHEQLSRVKHYTRDDQENSSFIQFERPFLYNSWTWYRDGCQKNVSQIFPNQTIYQDSIIPVIARRSNLTSERAGSKPYQFSYQPYLSHRMPYIQFYVGAGVSILQHLQGSTIQGILVPSSLYGRVTWHHESSTWQLLFAGQQLNCPTVISLKIFTQMMTGCAGHFDILINCPEDFTVTFNLSTVQSDLPDIFILQANDSRTSHNLVLSSLYSPLHVDEVRGRHDDVGREDFDEGWMNVAGYESYNEENDETGSEMSSSSNGNYLWLVWLPMLLVVLFTIISLVVIYGFYYYINTTMATIDYKAVAVNSNSPTHAASTAGGAGANSSLNSNPNTDSPLVMVALNNEKVNHLTTPTTPISSSTVIKDKPEISKPAKPQTVDDKKDEEKQQRSRLLIVSFILLYIIYSLLFSFSVTFGLLYLTQSQVWSNVSNPENLAHELRIQVDRSLGEIKQFEDTETERIFTSFLERRSACVNHLEQENIRLLKDYDGAMQKQLNAIFVQNGTLHRLTAQIQQHNVSAYIRQINLFLEDCNKTVHSIMDRFEANYLQFLRSTVLNDWLEFPRQIFLFQEGEKIDRPSLSSTQVKQLAAWLEVDKIEELLSVRENVFGRLSSVPIPRVSALDMTFPSATPHTPSNPSTLFDAEYSTFSLTPLEPTPVSTDSDDLDLQTVNASLVIGSLPSMSARFSALKGYQPARSRQKRSDAKDGVTDETVDEPTTTVAQTGRDGYNTFGLSGNLKANPDSSEFSEEYIEEDGTPEPGLEVGVVPKESDSLDSEEQVQSGDAIDYNDDEDDVVDYISTSGQIDVDVYTTSRPTESTTNPGRSGYKSIEDSDEVLLDRSDEPIIETKVVSLEEHSVDAPANLLKNDKDPVLPGAEALEMDEKENESSEESDDRWLYVLIAVFLTLDIVLWAYRASWLSSQLHAIRHGYADRIPTDDACKQVLEIQTAYHLPAFNNSGLTTSPGTTPHHHPQQHDDNSSGYYVDGKDHSFYDTSGGGGGGGSSIRDSHGENMTFLQTLPRSGMREDNILQRIWQQKVDKATKEKQFGRGKGGASCGRSCSLGISRLWNSLCARLQRLFLSQLIWQGTVTFLALVLLSLLVHCASFWLTADHFRVLVGAQSAVSDVQWQLHASDHHLRSLALTLTGQLHRLQRLCDAEVDALTSVFFDTVNMQTTMFTSLLQTLCREAGGENCELLSAHLSTGGRIVGCSFLPLQAQTYHDLSLSNLEEILAREVTPLLKLSSHLVARCACVIAVMLCARLLCQASASTARHFLLLRGDLPRVRVYQAEELTNPMSGQSEVAGSTLQRSQSWVDSCESGVYVCEAEEGGGGNNHGGGGGGGFIGSGGGGRTVDIPLMPLPPTPPVPPPTTVRDNSVGVINSKEDVRVVQPAR